MVGFMIDALEIVGAKIKTVVSLYYLRVLQANSSLSGYALNVGFLNAKRY